MPEVFKTKNIIKKESQELNYKELLTNLSGSFDDYREKHKNDDRMYIVKMYDYYWNEIQKRNLELNQELAEALISFNLHGVLQKHINKFKGLNYETIVMTDIKRPDHFASLYFLLKIESPSQKLIDTLIEHNTAAHHLIENLDKINFFKKDDLMKLINIIFKLYDKKTSTDDYSSDILIQIIKHPIYQNIIEEDEFQFFLQTKLSFLIHSLTFKYFKRNIGKNKNIDLLLNSLSGNEKLENNEQEFEEKKEAFSKFENYNKILGGTLKKFRKKEITPNEILKELKANNIKLDQNLAIYLIYNNSENIFFDLYFEFKNINIENLIIYAFAEKKEFSINHLFSFINKPNQKFAEKLLEYVKPSVLAKYLFHFKSLNTELVNPFIEEYLHEKSKFHGQTPQRIYFHADEITLFLNNVFNDIKNKECLYTEENQKLIINIINNLILNFNINDYGNKKKEECIKSFFKYSDIKKKEKLIKIFEEKRSFYLEVINKFGKNTPQELADIYKKMKNNSLSKADKINLRKLGLKNFNDNELKQKMWQVRDNLIDNDKINPKLLENPLAIALIKANVRFKKSQWKGDYDFEEILENFFTFQKKHPEKTLIDSEYPEKIIKVAKKEKEERIFSKNQKRSYKKRLKEIKVVKNDLTEKERIVFEKYKSEILFELNKNVEKLKKRLENKEKESPAYNGIKNKISKLEKQIKENKITNNFDNLLKINLTITGNKNLNLILNKILWYKAQKGFGNYIGEELNLNEEINQEDIDKIREKGNHILAEEYLKKLNQGLNIENKIKRENILNILNIASLKKKEKTKDKIQGEQEILIKASRALLMEFSGYFSDTCWTSESLLAKEYPWLSSLIFINKPNSVRDKKLVGSCFIIEGKTDEGEGILILRGNNPLKNFISELSVDDFMNKLLEYLEEVAKAKGIKKIALVLDDHAAGAASNREEIFDYYEEKYNKNKIIKLDQSYEVNDYDLKDNENIKIILIKELNS